MAAESYLNDVDLSSSEQVVRRLLSGNNAGGFSETGFVRFTGTSTQGQAYDFAQRPQDVQQILAANWH